LRKSRAVPWAVYNNWVYLAHKLYQPVLIADEAHRLIDIIRDMNAHRLWWEDYGYPNTVNTYQGVYDWLAAMPASRREGDRKLSLMWKDLNSGAPRYLIERAVEPLRGVPKDCIKLVPIDVSDAKPILWPDKVKKVVLLSATISYKDVEQLGLDKRRVKYIEADSPISADKRPISLDYVTAVNHSNAESPRLLAERVHQLLQQKPGKGLVHITYGLAEAMRPYLTDQSRLIWHGKEDKQERLEEFKASTDGVLMAAGLQEGLDLPYDLARWQAIAKVPWPSLGEPAVRYLAEEDPEWYQWEAARLVLQAAGRVCRKLDDWGETIILDKTFERLYSENQALFPGWWREAVKYANV